jgi:hypothetical protein
MFLIVFALMVNLSNVKNETEKPCIDGIPLSGSFLRRFINTPEQPRFFECD